MAKKIETLVADINDTVAARAASSSYIVESNRYNRHVDDMFRPSDPTRVHNSKALHASKLGKNCLRQMWYGQWLPGTAEPLQSHTLIKFTYGDLVEEFALDLVKAAGHSVEQEQFRIEFPVDLGFTVSGRIDAVIDGHVVDVKSTSPYSFKDWANRPLTGDNDSFGYRWQLHAYGRAAQMGQIDANTDRGYLLLMDKQNGHVALSWVDYDWKAFDFRLKLITQAVENKDVIPTRGFGASERDKLGNYKLPVECGYCDFKRECWRDHDPKAVLRSGKVTWLVSEKSGGKTKLKTGELELT